MPTCVTTCFYPLCGHMNMSVSAESLPMVVVRCDPCSRKKIQRLCGLTSDCFPSSELLVSFDELLSTVFSLPLPRVGSPDISSSHSHSLTQNQTKPFLKQLLSHKNVKPAVPLISNLECFQSLFSSRKACSLTRPLRHLSQKNVNHGVVFRIIHFFGQLSPCSVK